MIECPNCGIKQAALELPPEVKPVEANIDSGWIRSILGVVTEEELAGGLGVKVVTLQSWRAKGIGPAPVKLGKSVFYRLGDLRSWVDAASKPAFVPEVAEQ